MNDGDAPAMKDSEAIASVPLFQGLNEEIICSLLDLSTLHHIPKGTCLFTAGNICAALFIVKKGMVEISRTGEDGKRIIVHHASTGALLGDTVLFNEGIYEADASTLEDTELFSIDKIGFEELIHSHPELGIRILSDFGKRIETLQAMVAEIALSGVKKRIIRLIFELIRVTKEGCISQVFIENRNCIMLTNVPTQDEMACRIGTVREVLCRALHKLEKADLIRIRRGHIIIQDVRRLREEGYEEKEYSLFPIMLPTRRHVRKQPDHLSPDRMI
jgi:CRP/FNR family cyclic AMP-dependent transcriptional regulator